MRQISYFDKDGRLILPGTIVKIPVMPNWLIHDLPSEDADALRKIEGKDMPILEIDEHGYVWFSSKGSDSRWFCLRPEELESAAGK